MNIENLQIPRGYSPVTKLEFNIMANRHTLANAGFSKTQIEKLESTLKIRNKVLKSAKLAKRNLQNIFEGKKEQPIIPEPIICDICSGNIGIGILQLTSPEQASEGWLLIEFTRQNEHKIYTIIPPSVVIDYSSRKVYLVCGACQDLLYLQPTESGLLIHQIRNKNGYVNLDIIEAAIAGAKGNV